MFALFLCGVGNVRTRISQMGANGRNSIVNGQWLIVMRGTRYPNAEKHPPSPPSKGGRAGRSVGGTGERLGVRPFGLGR